MPRLQQTKPMKKKPKSFIGHIRQLGLAALMTTGLTLQAQTTYLTEGHTDIDIGYEDNTFALGISYGEPEQDFDVNNTYLVALPGAHTTVPSDPSFSFLGSPGSGIWILPQVQNPSLLFLGFGAEGIDPGTFLNDQLTLTLENVSGPGSFSIYLNDGFGNPTQWFAGGNGSQETIATGAHTHVNWAFSEPGDYSVTLQGDAQLPDETPVSTGPVTFMFQVDAVPEPTPFALFGLAGSALLIFRKRK